MYLEELVESRKEFLQQLYNLSRFQLEGQFHGALSEEETLRTIAIDASWGMGKTYFAQALETMIANENSSSDKEKIKFMKFDAWKSDYFDDPMKSLIGELNEHDLINSEAIDKVKTLCSNGIKITMKALGRMLIRQFKLSDDDVALIKDMISGLNESELEDYKKYKGMVEGFKDAYAKDPRLKIIVIDELDRCRPDYAIKLLETVKHIFDIKNMLFIFLVNKEQLKSTVSTMYLKDDGTEEYFEKFFDLQFRLPEINYEEYFEKEYSRYSLSNIKLEVPIISTCDKLSEFLFFSILNKNREIFKNPSIRTLKKAFNKYKILIESLEKNQRNSYPLLVLLCIYFCECEFNSEIKTGEIPSVRIARIILETFFEESKIEENLSIGGKYYKLSNDDHIYSSLTENLFIGLYRLMEEIESNKIQINSGNKISQIKMHGLTLESNHVIQYGFENHYKIELPIETYFLQNHTENKSQTLLNWCKHKYFFIKSLKN